MARMRYVVTGGTGFIGRRVVSRILARFRAPKPQEVMTIEEFTKRFLDRVDPPITAYQEEKGIAPAAASQGLFSLSRLVAAGQFVDAAAARAH